MAHRKSMLELEIGMDGHVKDGKNNLVIKLSIQFPKKKPKNVKNPKKFKFTPPPLFPNFVNY
jgi:hypothetical protein